MITGQTRGTRMKWKAALSSKDRYELPWVVPILVELGLEWIVDTKVIIFHHVGVKEKQSFQRPSSDIRMHFLSWHNKILTWEHQAARKERDRGRRTWDWWSWKNRRWLQHRRMRKRKRMEQKSRTRAEEEEEKSMSAMQKEKGAKKGVRDQ